ncbi:MAG TPA: MlaD family protein [Amycolatopsis sp.]|nr:MlaD family protein [Amycolatopsis sp.]
MRRRTLIVVAALVVLVAAVTIAVTRGGQSYKVQVLMPTAVGLFPGAKVMVAGQQVGEISGVEAVENKALITATLTDGSVAPLHAGTQATISWASVIGVRVLDLVPGPAKNPALPSGARIDSPNERVELDDVLAALDAPTRAKLQGLVGQLNGTLNGREADLKATLQSAGPTVQALGEVLRSVGDDGPAIRSLITDLHAMTSQLDSRRTDLGQTVSELDTLTSQVAAKQDALNASLSELPSTVDAAKSTLDRVPNAVSKTSPLLQDLQPATAQLPEVARNLSPVLAQLSPTVAELRPTLVAAQSLLQETPGLLDSAHATLPGLNQAVNSLEPAVAFLRPYTPELAGWLSNWTGVFGSQTKAGNYARALITASGSSLDNNPGIVPPGMQQNQTPAPGSLVDQPWTDANGDGIR